MSVDALWTIYPNFKIINQNIPNKLSSLPDIVYFI
jgi:hypothetical protein